MRKIKFVTIIGSAAAAATFAMPAAAASASPWPAGHLAPVQTACDASPYCFSYTDGGGLKLASVPGFASLVQATTSASENGLADSAWYADHPAGLGGAARFQLFRGGVATGKFLTVSSAGQLVLGSTATGFFFTGDENPDGTFTGTWSTADGRVWTATSNGGRVNLAHLGLVPTAAQLWTTAKPTA